MVTSPSVLIGAGLCALLPGTNIVLMAVDIFAILSKSTPGWPNSQVQQLNAASYSQTHEVESRDMGEVSIRSKLSSDTGSIIIGYLPEEEPCSPRPTNLPIRLGPQSLQDRLISVELPPKEKLRASLPVKDAEKIIALALSPSGDRAALLFKYLCCIHPTSGSVAAGKISLELERSVQWTRLCIGAEYLAVYGTEQRPVFRNRVSCSIYNRTSAKPTASITLETGLRV